MTRARPLRRSLRHLPRHIAGAVAVELAIFLPLLVIPLFSVIDVGDYVRRRMQVEAAGQAAVSRVLSYCPSAATAPVVVSANCNGLSAAMTTSAQATSLGTNVTLTNTTEGFYCIVNATGTLVQVGTTATFGGTPTGSAVNCSTVTGAQAGKSVRYIQTTATHAYAPLVGVSIASLLPSPITRTVWMRLS